MDADNTGDAYNRITTKGFAYEVPDCGHAVRHIFEEWNADLKKFAFIFNMHTLLDDDRCINFDRQRNEIKTYNQSADSLKGFLGETMTFRWKFKLDSLFQPSPNFTHIHQIKPGDGINQDNPVMTITPRYKASGNKLQVIFISPDSVTTTLFEVNLSLFLGVWVEATEKILFSNTGTYNLVIKRVSDETVLLSYSNNNIGMWRDGSTFMRPKWGIYRSLNSISYLRDEFVRFDDFSLDKGTLVNLPSAPSGLIASPLSGGRIQLTWTDNSANEDQFRIERSIDGSTWRYYGPAAKNSTSFTDTVTSAIDYYYRVRSENTFGNSAFSNIATGSNPLPVELISFTLSNNDKNIILNWVTATETNSKNFEIERSSDNRLNWLIIGNVKSAFASNFPRHYSCTDKNLQAGTYQYRLKMIDNDGTYEYSNVIETEIALPLIYNLSQNYPNPFNPATVIKYALSYESKVNIIVYNSLGETVREVNVGIKQPGYYELNFNSSGLSSGVYFYSIQASSTSNNNNFSAFKKMILMK